MTELSILLIKQLSQGFVNIKKITSTFDVKLLSIYDTEENILISCLHSSSNILRLPDIRTFAWQEDNYNLNEYVLLTVNKLHEICYTLVKVKYIDEQSCSLDGSTCVKWNFQEVFTQFHHLTEKFKDVSRFEILKFEAKEAVFLIDKKTVVSVFLCLSSLPQIMSISELSDSGVPLRKIVLLKEMLFLLDGPGTKFYVYSLASDSNIFEYNFSESDFRNKESNVIKTFYVNIKGDVVVFVTENQQLYLLSLNSYQQNKQTANAITAFTKQYPSVKRVSDNFRRFSVSAGMLLPICFTCDISGLFLKELLIIENRMFFIYHGNHKSIVGLYTLDTDEGTLYREIDGGVFWIENSSREVIGPILLYFDSKISLLCYDIEQNKLVNELMIYPSSGTVERLAALNNWNSIQMDIEVLRLGLSNRKIYTVEFYLKTLFEGFCQLWKSSPSKTWHEKIESACTNWENILNLILENVHQNIMENIAYQYAEQLLQIAMNIMIQILDVMDQREPDKDYFSVCEKETMILKISKLLTKVRELVREQERPEARRDKQLSDQLALKRSFGEKWENAEPEEIIEQSLLTGIVLEAQSFFLCNNKPDTASFQRFEKACEALVQNCLRQREISKTLSILLNMGIDINSKLIDIFQSTPDMLIRTLVQEELCNRGLLATFETKLLKFLSILEKLYPCSSFEHAKLLLAEKSSGNVFCAVSPSKDELKVGDILPCNQDNSVNGAYCLIVLDQISSWDDHIKSRILAPHFLKNVYGNYFALEKDITMSSLSLWYYLLESGHIHHLTHWIENWLSSQNKSEDFVFANWPVTKAMVNAIPRIGSLHVSEALLNTLAMHGIFCNQELEETSLLLARIGRSQCDITGSTTFASPSLAVSVPDLIHRLVHYCLTHDLIHFLCFIFKLYIKEFYEWPICSCCDVPLFHLVKAFSLWSLDFNDFRLASDATIKLLQHNLGLPTASIHQLLLVAPFPLCLGVLLLRPQSLKESIEEALLSSQVSSRTIKEKFQTYPLLYNFLFKSSMERLHPDVTVYELLKGNGMFDVSQLFGWQFSNVFKSEDAVSELPHFSELRLSEQYGLKKDLTYLYYLMQGRPNYAYLKFVAQEATVESGLSQERIKASLKEVVDFALLNFQSSEITLACILFTELVGQDSFPIRTYLTAASLLHKSGLLEEDEDGKDNGVQKISKLFRLALTDKSFASDVISRMETIILKDWNSFSMEANALLNEIILWTPAMSISHLLGVSAGDVYLSECARQNKWLKFLIFAQIFQVSKDKVLKAAAKFSNTCIYYHIFHALQRKPSAFLITSETRSANVLKKPTKDMRKSLYSKIGVLQDSENPKKDVDPDDDRLSISSEDTSSTDLDAGFIILKDLFSQLLLVHKSDTPANYLLHNSFEVQNPVLAVFAASYPDSSMEQCLAVWLYSSLAHKLDSKRELDMIFSDKHLTSISTSDIEYLMVFCVVNRQLITLWQAVCIFLSTTPLLPLSEFLRDFLLYKKFDASLASFQKHLWEYPKKNSHQDSIIESTFWLENVSVCLLKAAVICCSNNYERLMLLRHFSHTRLEKTFAKEVVVPPFIKLCQMLHHAGDACNDIDMEKWFLSESDPSYKGACWEVLNQLLLWHRLSDAEAFAVVARLPLEDLRLLQVNQSVKEARQDSNWCELPYRIDFWKSIIHKLNQSPYTPQIAVEFLESQLEESDKYGEKFFLMKSILNILRLHPEIKLCDDLEIRRKKMWWWCIKAEINRELLPEFLDVVPMNDFNFKDVSFNISSSCSLDEVEKYAMNSIIDRFLFNKDLRQAFELAAMFGYRSEDLEIIQLCLQLARHEISPCDISFSVPQKRVEILSSRFIDSLLMWITTINIEALACHLNVIKCMHSLSQKSSATISICHHILVHYVVSLVLQQSYDSVAMGTDNISILRLLLSKKLNDQYILVKCFITVHSLADQVVANFLCEEIWHSLEIFFLFDLVYISDRAEPFSENLVYDPYHANESFRLLMKLVTDPSILGRALLDIYSSKTSELSSKSPEKYFSSAVELCICAHECFTNACDMDGISQILRNCQLLITYMEEAKLFPLMVRLFTGIGRYSEMIYVLDILKNSDKLSLLLDKKDPDPHLKLAVLEYLKRLPSAESEGHLFKNVAKNFGLHREKAEILEMAVQKQLSHLCKRNSDNGLKEELENALNSLAKAAKSYCKADCLHQAQNCACLAQLVALQIFILPRGIWVIGLDNVSVCRFITEHNDFSQSLIVANYYGCHDLWSQALLNNFVIKGNHNYLQDFQSHVELSESLFYDIAKRYLKLPSASESSIRNMKVVLSNCPNVKVRFSLVLELGFEDMKSELLSGEASSYLQDLIANDLLHSI